MSEGTGAAHFQGLIHRLNSGCPVRGDSRWRKVIFLVVTLRFGPCTKSLFIPEAPIQRLRTSMSLSSPFLFLKLYESVYCDYLFIDIALAVVASIKL